MQLDGNSTHAREIHPANTKEARQGGCEEYVGIEAMSGARMGCQRMFDGSEGRDIVSAERGVENGTAWETRLRESSPHVQSPVHYVKSTRKKATSRTSKDHQKMDEKQPLVNDEKS